MTNRNFSRILWLLVALVLCVALCCACQQQEQPVQTNPTTATEKGKPILPIMTTPITGATTDKPTYTPVYVTVIDEVAYIATIPVERQENETTETGGLSDGMQIVEEDVCLPREISQGGYVSCNGAHERETPITKVIILETVVPRACNNWFRNLTWLESVEGLEKLDIQYVTDMSFMFAGCESLTELDIDGWDVTGVEDMTGMFDGCDALEEKPVWYIVEE